MRHVQHLVGNGINMPSAGGWLLFVLAHLVRRDLLSGFGPVISQGSDREASDLEEADDGDRLSFV